METFDELLEKHRLAIVRYVKFRLPFSADTEDVVQEVCLAAYQRFHTLHNQDAFLPWVIGIARNQCAAWFRRNAAKPETALDENVMDLLSYTRYGLSISQGVSDVLDHLGEQDRQMLRWFFFERFTQAEIAQKLSIPLGTVKSRIYAAKKSFRTVYLDEEKEDTNMTRLPEKMPDYQIIPSSLPPFEVVCEQLPGWMIVPRLGEKLSWGLYEGDNGKRTEYTEIRVNCKAEIHGIEGVEISAVQYDAENYYRTGSVDRMERRFIAQVTDTHCRYLAESHVEDGIRKTYTFLDGERFMNNWGFGPDNCGMETHLKARGRIRRNGNEITSVNASETMDVVGRYTVILNGKEYDTICLMDVQCFDDAIATEQFIDQNGRTVLWRRFNRNDWAFKRYQQLWTEKLPQNERLTVNGVTYVHWYDCLTDDVL